MFNRKFMILAILIVGLLAISAVSAEDNATSDAAGEGADESDGLSSVEESLTDSAQDDDLSAESSDLNIEDSDFKSGEEKLADSDVRSFKVISSLLNWDYREYPINWTIELDPVHYKCYNESEYIHIPSYSHLDNFTINGNGATLDANGFFRIILLSSGNLVLKDVNFINCSAYVGPSPSGDTVLGFDDVNITIVGCKFLNCHSPARSGNLFISNCIFENCSPVVARFNLNINNCSFKNSSSAIHLSNGSVVGCSFEDCYSEYYSGAIHCEGNVSIIDCGFVNCSSKIGGGAIYSHNINQYGSVVNCSFVNCSSQDDERSIIDFVHGNLTVNNCFFMCSPASRHQSAIYFIGDNLNVSDSIFRNAGLYSPNDYPNVALCSFMNCVRAVISDGGNFADCSFINCSDSAADVNYGNFTDCRFLNCSGDNGGAINLDKGNVVRCSFVSCCATNYGGGIYFRYNGSSMFDCYFRDNTAKNGSDWYSEYDIENIITRVPTALVASQVTATYGVSKDLVVTLKDGNGSALESKNVTVNVGSISKTLTTDAQGQVRVDVSSLIPDTYVAAIEFAGDEKFIRSSANADVTVKKATPKITAAKKTSFKAKSKNKKVKMTLKANGRAISGVKVAIKVNKKTYTAKTKSSGKATFKITKLTKKGSYKATISYKGNAYYNAKSVKVKITLK